MQYDLEERCEKFGEAVIDFLKVIPETTLNRPIKNQLIRSATSVGANYMEANQAVSNKDFKNKIGICRKESNETKHWLRMLARLDDEKSEQCRKLWKEAHELTLIFGSIFQSSKQKEEVKKTVADAEN